MDPAWSSRVDVLGVGISAVTQAQSVDAIGSWIAGDDRKYICVTGVHGVMECQRSAGLLGIHERSGLTVPDGVPLVWAAHHAGAEHVERVYGPDLMLAACERAASKGWRCFFYGGQDGVPELLAKQLVERFPGLQVAGCYSPPFRALTAAEESAEIKLINESRADIVWVGLSTPKQERWMASRFGALEVPVMVGVGAAFDFHAGLLRQAPGWMQRHGLEWLFRLCMEPRRLWRRYLRNNPEFVLAVLRRRPYLRAASFTGPAPVPSRLLTQDSRGVSYDSASRGNVVNDDRAGSNGHVVANVDGA
jgi:N-acetylglucosaminyldiphosphoundecaprenol N-acetyl-beta-D-mannosaminyltransferase